MPVLVVSHLGFTVPHRIAEAFIIAWLGRHYNPASLHPEQSLSELSFLLPQAHVS